jgi:hypothetical protein
MSVRSGANGGGKGGRNFRLNWSTYLTFGDWSIQENFRGTSMPWAVVYKNEIVQRAHGAFTGYRRFKTAENAKRWVERYLRGRS